MSNYNSDIVSKVWSFCNTLHDDSVGYGDYLEQLTYQLFLKMAKHKAHYTFLLRELVKEKVSLAKSSQKSE